MLRRWTWLRGRPLLAAGGGVLCIAGAWAAPASSTHRDNPVLEAVVGTNDGFDISLNNPDGSKALTLAAGTYTVVVHDRSSLHNFHLASNFDGSVDFRTDIDFVGDMTFTVTFKPGVRYDYACEPHFQTMNGHFTVNSPTSSTTTTTTPPPPAVPRLVAHVTASGSASLRPATVRHGLVRIVVTDGSKRHNFHLAGATANRKTTQSFVGKQTWSLRLAAGVYHFGSDPKRLRGVLRVR